MAKQYLLFARKEIDTNKQSVSVNQIVQMEGYNYPKYVVYKIEKTDWGINYHLIDINNHTFNSTTHIRPLSEKFGIGIYYDDKDPQFMTAEEVAELLTKAQVKKEIRRATSRGGKETQRRSTSNWQRMA